MVPDVQVHVLSPLLPGMKVVCLQEMVADHGRVLHPSGSVALVVYAPPVAERDNQVRVRFVDGLEELVPRDKLVPLVEYQEGQSFENPTFDPSNRLIYRCVIGSQAYGLEDEKSDVDYRGIFLPTANDHWSLHGVPAQWENQTTQEHYWEIQRFIVLALKANPNVLECLYTPLVEKSTPLADELLQMREVFLSKLVYHTFNGYVLSQFKKMKSDVEKYEHPKPKHAMHLIRLLLAGIGMLRHGAMQVRVNEYREELRAIKRGEIAWTEVEKWRKSLHQEFDAAFTQTKLSEYPNYAWANEFLIRARRSAMLEGVPCGSIPG